MSISRSHSREIARSTMAILEAGKYRTESGTLVSISDRLQQAISGTESYPPDVDIPTIRPGVKPTRITVDNMTREGKRDITDIDRWRGELATGTCTQTLDASGLGAKEALFSDDPFSLTPRLASRDVASLT